MVKQTINLLLTSFVIWLYLFVVTQWETIQFSMQSVHGVVMTIALTLFVVSFYEMLKPVTEHIVNKFKRKEKEDEI